MRDLFAAEAASQIALRPRFVCQKHTRAAAAVYDINSQRCGMAVHEFGAPNVAQNRGVLRVITVSNARLDAAACGASGKITPSIYTRTRARARLFSYHGSMTSIACATCKACLSALGARMFASIDIDKYKSETAAPCRQTIVIQ